MRKVSEAYKKRLIDGAVEIMENDVWGTNSVVYLPQPGSHWSHRRHFYLSHDTFRSSGF